MTRLYPRLVVRNYLKSLGVGRIHLKFLLYITKNLLAPRRGRSCCYLPKSLSGKHSSWLYDIYLSSLLFMFLDIIELLFSVGSVLWLVLMTVTL